VRSCVRGEAKEVGSKKEDLIAQNKARRRKREETIDRGGRGASIRVSAILGERGSGEEGTSFSKALSRSPEFIEIRIFSLFLSLSLSLSLSFQSIWISIRSEKISRFLSIFIFYEIKIKLQVDLSFNYFIINYYIIASCNHGRQKLLFLDLSRIII